MKRTIIPAIACLVLTTGCTQPEIDEWNRMFGDWKWEPQPIFTGKQETWTIQCGSYSGGERRELANRLAKMLKQVPDLNAESVWVEHGLDDSRLYYGEYDLQYAKEQKGWFQKTEPEETIQLSDAIKRDLDYIRKLSTRNQHPFREARYLRKPIPDVGPEDWDLRNASGVYTLHVGVAYPTENLHDYKTAAIEWVKDLRSRGYEAYYYHDPENTRTSICVGTFGADAVREDTEQGKRIISAEVLALRKREELGFNLENGAKVYRSMRNEKTGQVARMPNVSFLVKMPGQE